MRRLRRMFSTGGDRRLVLLASAVVGIVGLVAVVTAWSIARSRQGFSPLLVTSALLLSSILAIVVLFVLGRNLVKLWLDRSRGVPGSRYRTKAIALVAGLTLLPSLVLFFIASGLLQAAVEQWFQPEVERVLEDGRLLLDRYEAEEAARGLRFARGLVGGIAEGSLLQPRNRRALVDYVEAKRDEYGLAGARVYDARGRLVAESYDPVHERVVRPRGLPERQLAALVGGSAETLRHVPEHDDELLMFLGVPIAAAQGRPRGAVVVAHAFGPSRSEALARINASWQAYEQAKANRAGVRQGFVLVLALFTLVLLFSAVWVGSSLAKRMTVPIQSLAEATQAISEGKLDVRVDVDAPDELGVLVRSFNRMVDELRTGRMDVERSTLDLQRTNLELEDRRKYIETVLENSPTGVVSFDETGRLTNLNRSAMQMFGFRDLPPAGSHFREVFASKEFLELRILVEKVMGLRDISLVREIHLRHERRSVDLAVSFSALRDAQDRYIGLILVLEDISNLIKAQKIAAWREVARRIAHEIKNPLTPIQLSAQRILKKWREGDAEVGRVIEECCGTITEYVDDLKTLVNEFSRFARMPPVQPVPTQIDKVVQAALVLYEGLHPNLVIERHVAADIPTMSVDPEQLKRVLINLVDNAIHCQDGDGHVAVTCGYDPRTQSARIEVADAGPGIPPEDRDKLFVPYFSTKRGGTGLGLAIVHRIVSDHNGRISVEDNVPHGTRFIVELPA